MGERGGGEIGKADFPSAKSLDEGSEKSKRKELAQGGVVTN